MRKAILVGIAFTAAVSLFLGYRYFYTDNSIPTVSTALKDNNLVRDRDVTQAAFRDRSAEPRKSTRIPRNGQKYKLSLPYSTPGQALNYQYDYKQYGAIRLRINTNSYATCDTWMSNNKMYDGDNFAIMAIFRDRYGDPVSYITTKRGIDARVLGGSRVKHTTCDTYISSDAVTVEYVYTTVDKYNDSAIWSSLKVLLGAFGVSAPFVTLEDAEMIERVLDIIL